MKTIFILLFIWGGSRAWAGVDLAIKFGAELDQWNIAKSELFEGNLSPIYKAYEQRDLKLLWNFFDKSYNGALEPPNKNGLNVRYSEKEIQYVNITVRNYSGRLLSQIPGHAKYLGDEIDALANKTDIMSVRRNRYFNKLAELGSDECLHEIGRFWDDTRGRLPSDKEQSVIESYRLHPSDSGLQLPSSVSQVARTAMYRARYAYPSQRSEKGIPRTRLTIEADIKKTEEWWQSPESAKYRQPIDLTRPPPAEPAPELLSVKDIRQKSEPNIESSTHSTLAETIEWKLYVVVSVAIGCLVWLYTRKKKGNNDASRN